MSKTKNQKENKRKVSGPKPRYKQNGRTVTHGSIDDAIARMENDFYQYLSDIFRHASWDGKNWIKPSGISNFRNYLEEDNEHLYESNLELRDELINRKLIFQSENYYWTKALEYQKHLENGGADLTQPNPNIHKTEWIEVPDAQPIKVLINNETGEFFQVPVEAEQ